MGAGIDTGFPDVLPGITSGTFSSFLNFDYTSVIRSAFDAWSAVANIKFVQVADNGGAGASQYISDIRIAAEFIDGFGDLQEDTLAETYFPTANGGVQSPLAGNMIVDLGEPLTQQEFYLTVLHEIGHSLGLDHEFVNLAIMNPFLNTSLSGLQQDDINGIVSIYNWSTGAILAYTMPDIAGAQPLTILNGFAGAIYNGNSSNNVISGSSLAETLNGQGGNDTIGSGAGNDYIDGGTGADTMGGLTGDDTYVLDNASDIVLENAGEGTDTVISGLSYTLTADVENLTLSGTAIAGIGNGDSNAIAGNGSNNTLIGNGGNDTLDGGMGNDTLIGGTGDDTYVVDSASDVVTENAGEGTDLLMSAVTVSALDGNLENVILTGGFSNTNATGNAGNNTIIGNAGNNTLAGGDGNDVLDGTRGTDTLIGGMGDDTYLFNSSTDIVALVENSGEGTDWIRSSIDVVSVAANIENVELTGISSILVWGNSADNILLGNSGNNNLRGGAGNDTMAGGAGNDTYQIDSPLDVIVEVANNGIDTVQSLLATAYTLDANFENLFLAGTGTVGIGNAADNTIVGTYNGPFAGSNTLYGLDGNDTLWGGSSYDTLYGGNGDDVIHDTGGSGGVGDTFVGGAGNDTYYTSDYTHVMIEDAGEGTDTLVLSPFHGGLPTVNAVLQANVENLILGGGDSHSASGNAGNNVLIGNAGANSLAGLVGNDTLDGGDGDDMLNGGADNDVLIGGAGADVAVFSGSRAGYSIVKSGNGDVIVTGADGTDLVQSTEFLQFSDQTLSVSSLPSLVQGTAGNDVLNGGLNNDAIDGLAGADTMTGLGGDDTYYVDNPGDLVVEQSGGGTDLVRSTVHHGLAANVENLELLGTADLAGAGNALINILTGNSGNNILNPLGGADTMIGGAGNDTYYVDNLGDVVTENPGEGTADLVIAQIGGLTLAANVESGSLAVAGLMAGNSAANVLTGSAGNDTLTGGLGNDTLIGGAGTDIATFAGNQSGYALTKNANGDVTIVGGDGTDLAQGIETLQFADQVVSVASLSAPVVPDLWSYISLDGTTVAAGGSASVTAYVVNQGTGAAAGSTTGFYLSTDAVITTADTLLATKVS
ncbi:MAG: matrixin family metalloprotease, partial [Alphaproteobacteria bacterium]|nr:matrixin family metalloprotease [Alphaproteobacteria bacterium]